MAKQMASNNASVREKLAQLYEDGTSLPNDNAHTIWNRVFVGGVFQVLLDFNLKFYRSLTVQILGAECCTAILDCRWT